MPRMPVAVAPWLVAAAAVLFVAQVPAVLASTDGATAPVTFTLKQQNRSGQSGTATLAVRADGTTVVKLRVSKPVRFPGSFQMAHIHKVTCAKYASIKSFNGKTNTIYQGLASVDRGRSTSFVYVPLAKWATGKTSINVHSHEYPYTTVVCGDIPKQ
jgi:hypothetical protein